jgi:hypothetical protein
MHEHFSGSIHVPNLRLIQINGGNRITAFNRAMKSVNSTIHPDDGSWLSAQQAVLPDGTEVGNLPLVNKKLPQLYNPDEPEHAIAPAQTPHLPQAAVKAIEFAVAIPDGLDYLRAWLQHDEPAIQQKWPTAPR